MEGRRREADIGRSDRCPKVVCRVELVGAHQALVKLFWENLSEKPGDIKPRFSQSCSLAAMISSFVVLRLRGLLLLISNRGALRIPFVNLFVSFALPPRRDVFFNSCVGVDDCAFLHRTAPRRFSSLVYPDVMASYYSRTSSLSFVRDLAMQASKMSRNPVPRGSYRARLYLFCLME